MRFTNEYGLTPRECECERERERECYKSKKNQLKEDNLAQLSGIDLAETRVGGVNVAVLNPTSSLADM